MAHDTVYFHGTAYTTDSLNSLTSAQLLDIYNRLAHGQGAKPVSRFESHAKGVIRVWNALTRYAAAVVVEDAIDNPDTTPNSNLDHGADFETGEFTLPDDLDDDGLSGAIAELKGKSEALGKAVKKAVAVAVKPVSKVERLLATLRSLPDGADITALSCALGCDAKRVRGLIDSARSRGTRIVKVDGAKSTWRIEA